MLLFCKNLIYYNKIDILFWNNDINKMDDLRINNENIIITLVKPENGLTIQAFMDNINDKNIIVKLTPLSMTEYYPVIFRYNCEFISGPNICDPYYTYIKRSKLIGNIKKYYQFNFDDYTMSRSKITDKEYKVFMKLKDKYSDEKIQIIQHEYEGFLETDYSEEENYDFYIKDIIIKEINQSEYDSLKYDGYVDFYDVLVNKFEKLEYISWYDLY